MLKFALGIIETKGLVTAMNAADAALKSANVELIGIENSKGLGLMTLKFKGDVGAVNAAIQAGCAAAELVGEVYSKVVIARAHSEIEVLLGNDMKEIATEVSNEDLKKDADTYSADENNEALIKNPDKICNLCEDPNCPREKGEAKALCIHYDEDNKLKGDI